jgi:hypothetical protein
MCFRAQAENGYSPPSRWGTMKYISTMRWKREIHRLLRYLRIYGRYENQFFISKVSVIKQKPGNRLWKGGLSDGKVILFY